MALIKSLGLLAASILAAALSRIVVEEIGAWSPSIIHNLIKLAVSLLPENRRERFEEEWQSHVNEVPGIVGKLLVAAGLVIAAYKMAHTAQRDEMVEDWLQKVVHLQDSNSKLIMAVNAMRDGESLTSEERIKLKPHLDQLSAILDPRKTLIDDLAAAVSLYSVAPKSLAQKLLHRRIRREIQENFDEVSRGAEQMNEKSDQLMKVMGELSERRNN